jgi:hypothetical protein
MILPLAWKEYREQRSIWLILLATSLIALYAVVQIFAPAAATQIHRDLLVVMVVILVATAGIYGVVCGSLLLAGEDESGMQPFLHRHAGWRFRIWIGKFLIGSILTITFGLALAGGWQLINVQSEGLRFETFYWVLPAAAVEAFAWGLLGGALMRTTMAAAVVSAVFVIIVWMTTGFSSESQDLLRARVAMLVLALVTAALIYCDRDVRRIMTAGRVERLLTRNRAPGGWLSLFWLLYRQTRWQMLLLTAIGAVVGVFLLPLFGSLAWGAYSLVLGMVFGVSLFPGDQPAGKVFLGERRIPPWQVWWAKMLWALLFMAGMTVILTGLLNIHTEMDIVLKQASRDHINRELGPLPILTHDTGQLVFAVYCAAYGFCIGQLLSFLFRKSLVALVLTLLLSCLLPLVWVPSMVAGGLRPWQLFLPLLPLLMATWLVMRAWMADRLTTWRPALVVLACVFLAVLLTVGGICYRVVQIPDVGKPLDVDSFRAQLSRERTGKLELALREVVSDYQANRKRISEEWVAKGNGDNEQASADQVFGEPLNKVVHGGATHLDKDLARFLDEMFAGKWVEELQEALLLPADMLDNPNTMGSFVSSRLGYELDTIAQLLRARALQLWNRGDQPGAVQQLASMLRLSRIMRYRASLDRHFSGNRIERLALDGVGSWLNQERPPPVSLVHSLFTQLGEEERKRPSLRETLKVEEVARHNMLSEPVYLAALFDPERRFVPDQSSKKMDQYLALATVQIPWEKERLRRRVDQFSQRFLGALELPFPIERPFMNRDQRNPRAMIEEEIERNGLHMEVRTARMLNFMDKAGLCRLRATRVVLALVLYQLEEGKTAPSLDSLVPRYFDALPEDPYSGKPFRYRVSAGEWFIEGPEENTKSTMIGPGGALGWFIWFGPAMEVKDEMPGEAAPNPGRQGGPPVGGAMPGMAGGGGDMADPPFADSGFAVGFTAYLGLWSSPLGLGFLESNWMLPGFDLGPDRFRAVASGQGVLWSVGPDGVDNGGKRSGPVSPFDANRGLDLIFVVPDFVHR